MKKNNNVLLKNRKITDFVQVRSRDESHGLTPDLNLKKNRDSHSEKEKNSVETNKMKIEKMKNEFPERKIRKINIENVKKVQVQEKRSKT